jgi:hypothetical protein
MELDLADTGLELVKKYVLKGNGYLSKVICIGLEVYFISVK